MYRRIFIFSLLGQLVLGTSGWSQHDLNALRTRFEFQNQVRQKNIKNFGRQVLNDPASGYHLLLVDVTNGIPIFRETLNAAAAKTTNTTLLQNGALGLDLQGEGMLVGVWDDGMVADHTELANRVVAKEGDVASLHATHVTGTLIASGINPQAKGMAPLASAATAYFDNDLAKMAALSAPDQSSLLLSNHSYGQVTGWSKNSGSWIWWGDDAISSTEDYRFGFYSDRARDLDDLAFLAPYHTIVWAAGNDRIEVGNGTHLPDCNGGSGYDCIIPDAVAKNVITVGAVNQVLNYTGAPDVEMSNFSSWGPTDDGRIKPDFVADGVNLFSLSSASPTAYTILSGTSMATPNATGSLLLLQELHSRLQGGKVMKSATLKALAIHTTKESGAFPGPDYSFGWGLLDVAAASEVLTGRDDLNNFVLEKELITGASFELELQPKDAEKITATLVWTDPSGTSLVPALDPVDLMLVNDLDLRITDDQGVSQFPWRLDPLNPSQKASKGDNFRDNVEKIEFNLPQSKKYKLTVTHKGQLVNGRQEFSLIISHATSLVSSKTFYWTGDSGNWTDGSHWSLSTGGSAAAQVPGPLDRVIVDENSFDGNGADLIFLPQDVSLSSLVWLRNKSSGIDFNGKGITISKSLSIGSDQFSIQGSGAFYFAGNGAGSVFIRKSNLANTMLTFQSGSWRLSGHITADRVELNGGQINFLGAKIDVNQFNSSNTQARTVDLSDGQITMRQSSTITSTGLTLDSGEATLISEGNTTLNWQNLDWQGEVIAREENLTVNGVNSVSKLSVESQLTVSGVATINNFFAARGTTINFQNGGELTLNNTASIDGTIAEPVKLMGSFNALLSSGPHAKLCFDFLEVSGVDVDANSVVSAGTNSTVVNAKNWQQKNCDDVLFADFKTTYSCKGGLTHFSDLSSGSPAQWAWNFGDGGSSTQQNPKHEYTTAGDFIVLLTVTRGAISHAYGTIVNVSDNFLPGNAIANSNDQLTSFVMADSYQWYRDGVEIAGAVERSYAFSGQDGVYEVVLYGDGCNKVSDALTVTGLADEAANELRVYPNPATDRLFISALPGSPVLKVELLDVLGKAYSQEQGSELNLWGLSRGVYILKITTASGEQFRKVMIDK